ncbi:MAG TPA: DUF3368 domain-containing protein [Verrucomicrobiae bacterium]|nr:DUF3368 domain-containing protein [Verrucomicrobiae bacterium]
MAVVVSDTTPIHYLILIDRESILESLYEKVIIPPSVIAELQHPSAPEKVSAWAKNLPVWVKILSPRSVPEIYRNLDLGERQALALAKELCADLVFLDDKVARRAAVRDGLKVKGTLGIVADAANANLLDFIKTIEELQRTTMHLDQELVAEVIRIYQNAKDK